MDNEFITSLKSHLKSIKIKHINNMNNATTIDQKRATYKEYREELNKIKSNPEITAKYRFYKNNDKPKSYKELYHKLLKEKEVQLDKLKKIQNMIQSINNRGIEEDDDIYTEESEVYHDINIDKSQISKFEDFFNN
jgi:hypothetical protein